MLNIEERHNGTATILDLEGNVIMGGGSAKLRDAVSGLLKNDKTDILLNFEKVKYIDSSGTGEILSGFKSLHDAGGKLKLFNLSPKVREVLALSSILPLLDIYETEAEALA